MEKIDNEVAELEFERFCECNDLEVDYNLDILDGEDAKDLESHKRRFIRAVVQGRLTVDEAGAATYNCKNLGRHKELQTFVFKSAHMDVLLATDGKKDNQNVAKMASMLATVTGRSPKDFIKLSHKPDALDCLAIFSLLMA